MTLMIVMTELPILHRLCFAYTRPISGIKETFKLFLQPPDYPTKVLLHGLIKMPVSASAPARPALCSVTAPVSHLAASSSILYN